MSQWKTQSHNGARRAVQRRLPATEWEKGLQNRVMPEVELNLPDLLLECVAKAEDTLLNYTACIAF